MFYYSLGRLSKERNYHPKIFKDYHAASKEGIYTDFLHEKGEILAEELADTPTAGYIGVSVEVLIVFFCCKQVYS